MIGAFSYKGISSIDFDLVCKSISRPLLPSLKSNLLNIGTVSGATDFGGTEYDLRTVVMRIQYIGQLDIVTGWPSEFYELRTRARQIAAWLGGGTWERLIISGEDDKYYLAKIEDAVDLDTFFEYGEADITFTCQPFACSGSLIYSAEFPGGIPDPAEPPIVPPVPPPPKKINLTIVNHILNPSDPVPELITSLNTNIKALAADTPTLFTLNYPGTRRIDYKSQLGSKFDIEFTTDTGATFTINNKTLTYRGSGTFIINNVDMTVSNGPWSGFEGDIDTFLSIEPGENIISGLGATDVRITVIPLYY